MKEEGRRILGEAAEWLAALHSGEADESAQRNCRDWRAADPRHEHAYQKMEHLWRRFDTLQEGAGGAASSTLNKVLGERRRQRRLRGGSLLAVLLGVGVGLSLLTPLAPPDLLADYRSGTGEQRRVALPDGSELILNSATAVDLDYSAGERRIWLRRGEVLVSVAPDRSRPFVVESEAGSARALGTQYTVRTRARGLDVVVTESSVEICARRSALPARAHCAAAVAGQRARVRGDRVSAPETVDAAIETAWVKGRLVADDRPLSEVLDELGRYRAGLLHYDADALAGIRISGVFPLTDTDRALALIAAHVPIQVRHYTRFFTRVTAR